MKVVALNIRSGGKKNVAGVHSFAAGHDPDVLVLTEWRDTAEGRSLKEWATSRSMQCASLNDGATPNGVFVAARESFAVESRTPPGKTCAGVLMEVRFSRWAMLACYFPQLGSEGNIL